MKYTNDEFILTRDEAADVANFFDSIDTFWKDVKKDMLGYNKFKRIFKKIDKELMRTTKKYAMELIEIEKQIRREIKEEGKK